MGSSRITWRTQNLCNKNHNYELHHRIGRRRRQQSRSLRTRLLGSPEQGETESCGHVSPVSEGSMLTQFLCTKAWIQLQIHCRGQTHQNDRAWVKGSALSAEEAGNDSVFSSPSAMKYLPPRRLVEMREIIQWKNRVLLWAVKRMVMTNDSVANSGNFCTKFKSESIEFFN